MSLPASPLSISFCHTAFEDGSLTSESLTKALLSKIKEMNPNLRSYLSTSETAVAEAAAVDVLRQSYAQALGALSGIPISLKDLIDTDFLPTTYGSQRFEGHHPRKNAVIVERLQQANVIILGKTHLHEFAYGITNENEYFGNAANPCDSGRMTGGSSGGSAASVKAGLAVASVGTDTGGSIRIPAAWTGVVGYKPSLGLIPLDGVYPLAPTLDHVGPITNTVFDAAILAEIMSGHRLWRNAAEVRSAKKAFCNPIRVGVPKGLIQRFGHPQTKAWFEQVVHKLEQEKIVAQTCIIELPVEEIGRFQGHIIGAESYAIHEGAIEHQAHQYGEGTLQRIQATKAITARQYIEAQSGRRKIQMEMAMWFESCDVFLLPTTPIEAQPFGTQTVSFNDEDHILTRLLTRFTNPWNLTGLPAISIPVGSINGLPMGLQMVGPFGKDQALLQAAAKIEQIDINIQI